MSRRQRALLLRALLFLFLLNAITLFLYFFLSSPTPQTLTQSERQTVTKSQTHTLKPWPNLPSFVPWIPNPNPPRQSCEAYFGNGFSTRIQVFGPEPESEPDSSGGGFLRCFHSETLRSSVWVMGRVRMDPNRIRMSQGGEALEAVIGRSEEEEMPRYEAGAFEIEGVSEYADGRAVDEGFLDKYLPMGQVQDHTMRALVDSIRVVQHGKLECTQVLLVPWWISSSWEWWLDGSGGWQ